MLKKIQTLAAARKLDVFEVEKLAQDAEVSVSTVHTVLKRLPSDWYTVETPVSGERGGQRKRFSLTDKGRAAIDRELKRLPRVELSDGGEASRLERASAASAFRLERARGLATDSPNVSASLEQLAYAPAPDTGHLPDFEAPLPSVLWHDPMASWGRQAIPYGYQFLTMTAETPWRDDVFACRQLTRDYAGFCSASFAHESVKSRAFAVWSLGAQSATRQVVKTVANCLKLAAHFKQESLQLEEPSLADLTIFLRDWRTVERRRYAKIFVCCDSRELPLEAEERLRRLLKEALGSHIFAVLDAAYSERLESLVADGQGRYVSRATDVDPTPWIAEAVEGVRPASESARWGMPLRLSQS